MCFHLHNDPNKKEFMNGKNKDKWTELKVIRQTRPRQSVWKTRDQSVFTDNMLPVAHLSFTAYTVFSFSVWWVVPKEQFPKSLNHLFWLCLWISVCSLRGKLGLSWLGSLCVTAVKTQSVLLPLHNLLWSKWSIILQGPIRQRYPQALSSA